MIPNTKVRKQPSKIGRKGRIMCFTKKTMDKSEGSAFGV
jgi:hypothetical protein